MSDRVSRLEALARTLRETEEQLERLGDGELDAVVGPAGTTRLLGFAQRRLLSSEAERRRIAEVLEAILDTVPANIALLDPAGTIVAVNEEWRRFARENGLPMPDHGFGVNYLQVCDRAAAAGVAEAADVAAAVRAILAGDLDAFRRDYECHAPHERRWYRMWVRPVRRGTVGGAVVIHGAITAERLADEALRERELRFRLLANASSDGLWDWDLDSDSLWMNEGFFALAGAAPPGMRVVEWFAQSLHPDDREATLRSLERALGGSERTWVGEYRIRRRDGSWASVLDRAFVVRDASGRATRLVGGLTDLTEHRLAQERLAEQAALLDAAHEAILVKELDSRRILFWNRGAEHIYGWSAVEALGRTVTELYGSDAGDGAAARAELLARGIWQGEARHRTRDGRERVVEVRWTLLPATETRPAAVLAIHDDVTERRALERQLQRAQRLDSLGTLAGGIAHDLNNVLSPVLMGVDLLREGERDERRLRVLDTVAASVERGAAMVRQVLAFSRGGSGERREVDLAAVARDVSTLVLESFPKSIAVEIDVAPDLWPLVADPTQLQQVMMNLCLNARDAMPRGGRLRVSLANVAGTAVPETVRERGARWVRLRVADTGGGIPEEARERIFEPFFTTKDPGQGTGLGLSIVHSIVRSHGGLIDFATGRAGTTFEVFLPASVATSHDSSGSDGSAMPGGRGERVLVIDDEAPVRDLASEMLRSFGYQVLVAAGGAEAVAALVAHRGAIDAVITDVAMPVMDGTATVAALHAIEPDLPILVASGLPVPPDLAGEAAAVVAKPYTAGRLLRALHDVLARD